MLKPVLFPDKLTDVARVSRKLAALASVAPAELKAVEVLLDDALRRHRERARLQRLARFSRVT